ncbi:MAG TPA: ABC transporter substrate-binding protein [Rhizobiaceae bacterium]|nr:ABC transporter substrate-binding protein [Rhizobiaceae bacterium]
MTIKKQWNLHAHAVIAAWFVLAAAVAGMPNVAAAQQTDVSIGVNRNLLFVPAWIAKERGFYEKHGLNVTLQEVGGGAELRTAILSGAVQFIVQSPEGSAPLYVQGQRLVNVVATQGKLNWALVLGKQHDGKVNSGDLSALKGMTFGVTGRGSGGDMQLQALLRRGGLVPDQDVQIVAVGQYAAGIAAMQEGQIDGIMAVEPATAQALDAGGFVLVDYGQGNAYPGSDSVPMGALATTGEYLASNEPVARAVVESVVDAMMFIREDPAWSAEYIAKLSGLTVEQARRIVDKELVENSPVISEEGWNTLVGLLKEGGVLKVDVPYAEVVATQFADIWARYSKSAD